MSPASMETRQEDAERCGSRSPGRGVWERALSPDEWADLPHRLSEGPSDRATAEELAGRWRKVITVRSGSDQTFRNRLDALGIAEEEAWRRFLPATAAEEVTPPRWALLLDEALTIPEDECMDAIRMAGSPTSDEIAAYDLDKYPVPLFPHFVAPFLALFVRAGSQGAASYGLAAASLTRALLRRLSRVCARSAAYELKLSASRGDLEGADSSARYQFFCRHAIGTPRGRLRMIETYPVLGRLLATVCEQMMEVAAETLCRLREDGQAIATLFNGGVEPGPVTLCLPGISDMHRGGRSAWILGFENGLRVVYKPRSHRVDAAWSKLIAWWNETGLCLPLRAAKVLERDGYGWSEFIHTAECNSKEEAGRFYQRQGTLAALVWLLCGQDFHADNFIAAGEYPVPVDLEGILAPGISVALDDLSAMPPALRSLQYSAAGSLMLPYWRSGDRDRLLFQSSGIGGSGLRPWPTKQASFTNQDTDSLSVRYDYQQFVFDTSVPRMAGEKISVVPFLDRVQAGFGEAYRVILERRGELLDAAGPLENFRTIENRLVFRDTQDYANLLFWTTAPDLLVSGAAYDVALEVFAGSPPVFGNGNLWPEIAEEEKRSLWQRDIPIAYGCPTSTGMLFPSGRVVGPVIPLSMFEQLRLRLAQASPEDCAWQQSIAQALFELAATDTGSVTRVGAKPDQALATACEIGEDLVRTAVRQEHGVTWLSFARMAGAAMRVYPIQYDPWSLHGSAGNALFLANLARVTQDLRFETSARQGLAAAAHTLGQVLDGPFSSQIGGSVYYGSFGLVYALAACGVQLHDTALIAQAVDLATRHTPDRLMRERNPDFLIGAAGPVAVLSWLYTLSRETALLTQARAFAEIVRASAVEGGREGWQVPAFHRPLLGMAHGSAGIAMALLRLHRETGDQWMLESARAGLAHERDRFHPIDRQWPNLQERDGRVSFMTGWCAGAPGIGLARLAVARQFPDDSAIREEIDVAVEATRRQLGGYQHHLCCGEAGRIAFLRAAGLQSEAREAALRMVESFRSLGYWRMQEFSERLPIPGITGGVAGIGLALLSVVDPSCSEVLTLS